jgi:hypothetical protein
MFDSSIGRMVIDPDQAAASRRCFTAAPIDRFEWFDAEHSAMIRLA